MNVFETKAKVDPDSGRTESDTSRRRDDVGTDARRSGRRPGLTRRLAQILAPLLVIALGYGGYVYLKATRPEKPKRPPEERVFAIRSVAAKIETLQPKIKVYGTAVSGRSVDIRALVSGRVTEASAELKNGGVVNKGETLLQIDPFSYQNALAEAEAALAESKARLSELEASITQDQTALGTSEQQLAIAKRDLGRAEPLAKRGTVSDRTVDERRQTYLTRQQEVDRLTNTIKVWKTKVRQQRATIARQETARALAERRLEETELQAPFSAYVVDVTSQVGRMIGANDKVATLIDRDWMEARFTLSDEQFGRLLSDSAKIEGRDVDVVWVLGGKAITYPATIERVAGLVEAATGGVAVLARIKNPDEPVPLRSGAFVEILVPDKTYADVIRVPATALYGRDTVYVIDNGRLDGHTIEIVGADGNNILIKGQITAGERILATRISTPGDGVRVKEVD